MLTTWELTNFKPVEGTASLALGKITILAGLNSSGKSSVLQSILLVSQSLANQIVDRPLVLNGNIVQLGTFDGIHNDHAAGSCVGIGFELNFSDDREKRPARIGFGRSLARRSPFEEAIRSIQVKAEFEGVTGNPSDTTGIEAVKVALRRGSMRVDGIPDFRNFRRYVGPDLFADEAEMVNSTPIEVNLQHLTDEESSRFLEGLRPQFTGVVPIQDHTLYTADILTGDHKRLHDSPVLVRLAHFLPARLFVKYELRQRKKEELERIVSALLEDTYWSASPRSHEAIERVATYPVAHGLRDFAEAAALQSNVPQFDGRTVSDLLQWARETPLKTRAKGAFKKRIADQVVRTIGSAEDPNGASDGYGIEPFRGSPHSEILEAANFAVTNYFTGMLRYLGPLRADPQAAQGFAPSSQPDDVGPKGEYAAAVYDANRHQRIPWWDPNAGRETVSTLQQAMTNWVQYLGVAHQVSTREAGLSGVSWVIQSGPHAKERGLPSVGVGVSQVLPILVAGLLAPSGALLLFEQPELHLHARAQARLGDFFLGLANTGKQCLIETHSDSLVNQFRFHVVSGLAKPEADIAIYFVQQGPDGDAAFTTVEISPSGNIVNWPDGFFDESLHQEDKITREALRARKRNGAGA